MCRDRDSAAADGFNVRGRLFFFDIHLASSMWGFRVVFSLSSFQMPPCRWLYSYSQFSISTAFRCFLLRQIRRIWLSDFNSSWGRRYKSAAFPKLRYHSVSEVSFESIRKTVQSLSWNSSLCSHSASSPPWPHQLKTFRSSRTISRTSELTDTNSRTYSSKTMDLKW